MNSKAKLRTLVLLSVVIVMVIVLAAGLRRLEFQPGRTVPIMALLESLQVGGSPINGLGPLPFDPMPIFGALLWVALIASIILLIVSPEARREVLKRIITYIVLTLLFYGFVTAIQPYLRPPELELEAPQSGMGDISDAPAEPLPSPPEFVYNPPQWLTMAITILLLAIPLVIGWLLWNRYGAKKKPPPDDALEQITLEAKTALDEIEAGGDLKDTILHCYKQMSQTLANSRNLHRGRAMTPREFEQYLAEYGLRTEDIQRLTRLFESVRYGDKSPGKREEKEAVDCLNAIVRVYGTSL